MANFFDQFDTPAAAPAPGSVSAPSGNFFDKFDAPTTGGNFSGLYSKYGQQTNIDPRLIQAVSMTESNQNSSAVGPTIASGPDKGGHATGLMQVTDSTAKDFGGGNLTDPDTNIGIGARTLRRALDRTGNYRDALNAYSGGGGDAYVNKVMTNYQQLGGDPTKLGWTPGLPANSFSGQAERLMGNPAPVIAPTQRGYDAVMHRPTNQADLPGTLESGIVGAVHGALDVPANSLAEGATWLGDQTGLTNGAYDRVLGRVNQRNQQYSDFAAQHPIASGVGNIAGGVGTAALLTPGGLGPIMGGLLGGAEYGAMQNSAGNNSLLGDVAVNAGLGAGGGALVKGISKYALPALAAKFPGLARFIEGGAGAPERPPAFTGAPQRIEPTLTPQAPQVPRAPIQEVIPPGVPATAAEKDIADIRARQGAFEALGLQPTQAMISRQPGAYTEEANLAKNQAQTKLGGEVLQRYQTINQGLQNKLMDLRGETSNASPRQGAQQIINTLQDKWTAMQDQVGAVYQGILKTHGQDYAATPQSLAGVVKEHADNSDADSITNSIRRRFVSMGLPDPLGVMPPAKDVVQRTALSVGDSNNLRKFIGNLSADSPTKSLVKHQAIDALDDDVINGTGSDVLKAARDKARARFQEFERPVLKNIQQGKTEPEDVIRKTVIGGHVEDVRALVTALTKGNPTGGREALTEVRGQIIDHLLAAAHGVDGTGQFSPARFGKALQSLGDKLPYLFTPQQISDLRNVEMVGTAAFKEPAFSAINHSNSGIYNVHHEGGVGHFLRELPEKLENINKSVESLPGRLVFEGTGAGTAVRTASAAAKIPAWFAKRAAAKEMLHPDAEARIAAHFRATAAAPLQKFLRRLPMSQSTAALYDQQQSGQPTPQ